VIAPSIEPGATLGVLGGGQLGAMFALAGRRLGYRIAVWDPDADAPAHHVADISFPAPFNDSSSFAQFSQLVQAVTYEWENVPVSLCESLERHVPVRPSARVLRVLQDRLEHKGFLASRGFPVPPFQAVLSPEELRFAERVGFPCICKSATAGYDGKGQWQMAGRDDLPLVQQQLSKIQGGNARWIVEAFLRFERELSVLVVRGSDGECQVYPVAENVHESGILRMSQVPASVSASVAERATKLARQVVTALEGVGVFCVELFLMSDGTLLINEVAPRPHNSGHYTLDACSVSQFEQQVRVLCGLPLGEVRLFTPAVMVNLIGDEVNSVTTDQGEAALFGTPGAVLHLYGKRTIRAGRKMGHVTFMADKVESARDLALRFQDTFLKKTSIQ
jgi:5-(carboxyamino)imidazole ribonucleotide synthase